MNYPFSGTYPITQKFGVGSGYSTTCRKDGTHNGLDFGVPEGTPILAIEDGTIILAGPDSGYKGGYGQHVRTKNSKGGGVIYGHMKRLDVKAGQIVKAGDKLGISGNTGWSTGPHLHLEIRTDITRCNTCVDPLPLLTGQAVTPVTTDDPPTVGDAVAVGSFNVRLSPSMAGRIIGQLSDGDAVAYGCGQTVQVDDHTWQPIVVYVAAEGLKGR
jgi:murein DD-endopeptidase MepM/ murein hydrolase activator NlpD